jgi:hypothetical protein
MRRLPLAALLLLCACSTAPFRETELVPLDHLRPAEVLARFREGLPERFRVLNATVFDMAGRRVAALGVTEVDRVAGTFGVVAMNAMGVKLFELTGDGSQVAERFMLPGFIQQEGAAQAIGEDIRRVWLGVLPSAAAAVNRERTRIVFRETSGQGTMEYVFAGADGHLVEKRHRDDERTVWRVRYYEYRTNGGKVFPMGIVYSNERYGYRLEITVKEILE